MAHPNFSSASSPIVVIADDLTGAAELAGLAHARGFTAEVQTKYQARQSVQVIALDTDTRRRPPGEAAQVVGEIATTVARSRPAWIYKKTDSLLRGHVRVEVEAVLDATGLMNARLVPANPSRGRVIRDGEYFVEGVPLNETMFARDPAHPRTTARVVELLGAGPRVKVPDASTSGDVQEHARTLAVGTLPAGGVDFFNALLTEREVSQGVGKRQASAVLRNRRPALFVCGSAAAWNQGREEFSRARGIPCLELPEKILRPNCSDAARRAWCGRIAGELVRREVALIAIGGVTLTEKMLPPDQLPTQLAETVAALTSALNGGRVCAEGGATARALLERFQWRRLSVVREWAAGVVELRPIPAVGFNLICKVGSYPWPEELMALCQPAPEDLETAALPVDGVLDLHVFRPQDLGVLIPEYIAECRIRGILEVRIIHGKGTGQVRRSVLALLSRLPTVSGFSAAGARFGGAGATLVRLKSL